MSRLHLVVFQPGAGDREPTQASSRLWNCNRTDFAWNGDFTAFRVLPLRWWDDASYAAYQAADYGDEGGAS